MGRECNEPPLNGFKVEHLYDDNDHHHEGHEDRDDHDGDGNNDSMKKMQGSASSSSFAPRERNCAMSGKVQMGHPMTFHLLKTISHDLLEGNKVTNTLKKYAYCITTSSSRIILNSKSSQQKCRNKRFRRRDSGLNVSSDALANTVFDGKVFYKKCSQIFTLQIKFGILDKGHYTEEGKGEGRSKIGVGGRGVG